MDEIFNKNTADLFSKTKFNKLKVDRSQIISQIIQGGYPEMLNRHMESRRRSWFKSYITTLLQRDVKLLANIEGLTELPNLLALLSARTSSLLNYA
jgi:predicted AAA+ superfamily ATPase